MSTATFTIAASADDGMATGHGTSTPWPPPYFSVDDASNPVYVDTYPAVAPNYYYIEGLWRFDTSSLAGFTVVSAYLRVFITTQGNADSRNMQGEYYTWSAPLSSSNYSTSPGSSAFSVPLSTLSTGWTNITLTSPDFNINRSGYTGFRLSISGSAPTGTDGLYIDDYSVNPAQLVVTYTTPGLILGTVTASSTATEILGSMLHPSSADGVGQSGPVALGTIVTPTFTTPASQTFTEANVIDDAMRTIGIQGDGLAPGAGNGVGMYYGQTNLFTNSDCTTNANQWSSSDGVATVARDATTGKFGGTSLKVTTTAALNGCRTNGNSLAAATGYNASAWVNAPVGKALIFQVVRADLTTVIQSTAFTGDGTWNQRINHYFVPPASETVYVFIKDTSGTIYSFNVGGMQITQTIVGIDSRLPYPNIHTDGSTATRGTSSVQGPISLIDQTQGWIAFRFVPDWPVGGLAPTNLSMLRAQDSVPTHDYIDLSRERGAWSAKVRVGGTVYSTTFDSSAVVAGSPLTLIIKWNSTTVAGSRDGGAFASAASVIPDLSAATTIDIGCNSHDGNYQPPNGRILWVAGGISNLVDPTLNGHYADNAPPAPYQLPIAYGRWVWPAVDSTYTAITTSASATVNTAGNLSPDTISGSATAAESLAANILPNAVAGAATATEYLAQQINAISSGASSAQTSLSVQLQINADGRAALNNTIVYSPWLASITTAGSSSAVSALATTVATSSSDGSASVMVHLSPTFITRADGVSTTAAPVRSAIGFVTFADGQSSAIVDLMSSIRIHGPNGSSSTLAIFSQIIDTASSEGVSSAFASLGTVLATAGPSGAATATAKLSQMLEILEADGSTSATAYLVTTINNPRSDGFSSAIAKLSPIIKATANGAASPTLSSLKLFVDAKVSVPVDFKRQISELVVIPMEQNSHVDTTRGINTESKSVVHFYRIFSIVYLRNIRRLNTHYYDYFSGVNNQVNIPYSITNLRSSTVEINIEYLAQEVKQAVMPWSISDFLIPVPAERVSGIGTLVIKDKPTKNISGTVPGRG